MPISIYPDRVVVDGVNITGEHPMAKPGRPETGREARKIRMTPDEWERLDKASGDRPRGEYVAGLLPPDDDNPLATVMDLHDARLNMSMIDGELYVEVSIPSLTYADTSTCSLFVAGDEVRQWLDMPPADRAHCVSECIKTMREEELADANRLPVLQLLEEGPEVTT